MGTLSNTTTVTYQTGSEPASKLVYRFVDAPVPPQYHRSYTINVSQHKIDLTVDSYGDILAAYQLPLSEKAFQDLLAELRKMRVSVVAPKDNEGCAGGKTDSFDITFDDLSIRGHVYHCAGKKYGDLTGDTDKVARLFKGLVPGLERKVSV